MMDTSNMLDERHISDVSMLAHISTPPPRLANVLLAKAVPF